jgi:cell division protein FtsI/penicillin-binding protein 2
LAVTLLHQILKQQVMSKITDIINSDLAWSCIGYNQHISPVKMLTFYNAIANDGKMKTEYAVEYCGYFPADSPKYSIIVSMNKMGLPASGAFMAGSVFSEIVNYMVDSVKTAEK